MYLSRGFRAANEICLHDFSACIGSQTVPVCAVIMRWPGPNCALLRCRGMATKPFAPERAREILETLEEPAVFLAWPLIGWRWIGARNTCRKSWSRGQCDSASAQSDRDKVRLQLSLKCFDLQDNCSTGMLGHMMTKNNSSMDCGEGNSAQIHFEFIIVLNSDGCIYPNHLLYFYFFAYLKK